MEEMFLTYRVVFSFLSFSSSFSSLFSGGVNFLTFFVSNFNTRAAKMRIKISNISNTKYVKKQEFQLNSWFTLYRQSSRLSELSFGLNVFYGRPLPTPYWNCKQTRRNSIGYTYKLFFHKRSFSNMTFQYKRIFTNPMIG